MGCIGALGMTGLLQSCAPTRYLQAKKNGGSLQIARSEFLKSDGKKYRRSILVKTDELAYPIIVYRFSDHEYSALLLRCTHQGAELSVNGDLLSCAAHGSEFGTRGEVIQGPADENLVRYTVSTDTDNIYIQLA